ncbi:MAG: cytochrome c biogenesis protein CcsA [Rickettsiaceae bacterium H1]|nr:cytochrome c biogenesis protein CcsA [Rickettsiaceae bacterium H1]
MNPLLQDVALVIHPPILYLGYVGFSIIFSIATAYCYHDKFNIGKVIKPWILFTWSFLTLGIGLGSWWAYRELGWGGFWFWDPVENVSLIPWLLSLALLHDVLLVEKHRILERWVIFLSLFTFIVSIFGTFLVRSGTLNSVHSFAENPEQTLYATILITIILIGGIISYINFNKNHISYTQQEISLISYRSAILLNNWFLVISAIIILIGVLYPVIIRYFTSSSIIIPASYYDSALQKILLPFLLVWIAGPQLIIKKNIIKNNILPFCFGVITTFFFNTGNIITSLLLLLSVWLFFSLLFSYFGKIGLFTDKKNLTSILKQIGKSYYSMLLSHLGGSILVFAIICNSQFSSEKEKYMNIGESLEIERYKLILQKVEIEQQNNYKSLKATFNVNNSFNLTPEIRFYTIEEQSTAETVTYHNLLSDLYVIISEIDEELGIGVQVHYNKLINLIWFGVILIFIGGLLGISHTKPSNKNT